MTSRIGGAVVTLLVAILVLSSTLGSSWWSGPMVATVESTDDAGVTTTQPYKRRVMMNIGTMRAHRCDTKGEQRCEASPHAEKVGGAYSFFGVATLGTGTLLGLMIGVLAVMWLLGATLWRRRMAMAALVVLPLQMIAVLGFWFTVPTDVSFDRVRMSYDVGWGISSFGALIGMGLTVVIALVSMRKASERAVRVKPPVITAAPMGYPPLPPPHNSPAWQPPIEQAAWQPPVEQPAWQPPAQQPVWQPTPAQAEAANPPAWLPQITQPPAQASSLLDTQIDNSVGHAAPISTPAASTYPAPPAAVPLAVAPPAAVPLAVAPPAAVPLAVVPPALALARTMVSSPGKTIPPPIPSSSSAMKVPPPTVLPLPPLGALPPTTTPPPFGAVSAVPITTMPAGVVPSMTPVPNSNVNKAVTSAPGAGPLASTMILPPPLAASKPGPSLESLPPLPPLMAPAPESNAPVPATAPPPAAAIAVTSPEPGDATATDIVSPPPRELSAEPSPACPQCDAPMNWVDAHLRFFCKTCRTYF